MSKEEFINELMVYYSYSNKEYYDGSYYNPTFLIEELLTDFLNTKQSFSIENDYS